MEYAALDFDSLSGPYMGVWLPMSSDENICMATLQHLLDEERPKCPDDTVTKLACVVRLWPSVVCMGRWSYVRVFSVGKAQ